MNELRRDIVQCIGNTSLVALRNIVPRNGARILLKLENENPTGSMKDRMALAMIEAAEGNGRLKPGGSVVEYTGGSTGVSLSLICAVKRHPLHIVSSDAFSQEKLETLEFVSEAEELGRAHRIVSFTDATGTRVLLYFDAQTHLLTKSEMLREHAIAGDSFAEVIYLDYRSVGSLRLPFHHIDRTAGVPVEEMRVASIDVNSALPEGRFRPPADFAAVEEDPSQPHVQRLGENVYLIRGPYNIVFAAFRDHVVALEAPLNNRYAETCLRLIRETVPNKPVRYLVATHFHYDHVAGVRPYVAAGISIITTPDAKAIIEQVASSRRTMYPDALSHNPQPPKIETVQGRRVLDDGTNRIELYDLGPTDHIAQILMAYFPREKMLFEADVWDPISLQMDIAGPDTVNMARRIEELRLDVERIIPVHGVPTTMGALQRGLAVRKKYMP